VKVERASVRATHVDTQPQKKEHLMFKKIIWATDGSASAYRALPYARSLAQQEGGSIVVVHAVETYGGSRAAGLPLFVEEEETRARVDRQVAELQADGFDAALKIVTGFGVRAAHAIADAAEEVGADVIVTGTRGHTALGGLLLGSVTQRLLHIAPCPVLAVPAVHATERQPEAVLATRAPAEA
jgi:nucleotide-binding universal stress UspA family protein